MMILHYTINNFMALFKKIHIFFFGLRRTIFFMAIFFISSYEVLFSSFVSHEKAKVLLLNKLTGNYETVILQKDRIYTFDDNLHLVLRTCMKPSQKDDPENASFIQIVRTSKENITYKKEVTQVEMPADLSKLTKNSVARYFIFSGWFYSSSPSINFLEDPVYDVTLFKCM